jgi:hypothetical protein
MRITSKRASEREMSTRLQVLMMVCGQAHLVDVEDVYVGEELDLWPLVCARELVKRCRCVCERERENGSEYDGVSQPLDGVLVLGRELEQRSLALSIADDDLIPVLRERVALALEHSLELPHQLLLLACVWSSHQRSCRRAM